jgi:hypothetical protein
LELGIEIESKTGTSFGTRTKPEPNSGTKIETGIFEMKISEGKRKEKVQNQVLTGSYQVTQNWNWNWA